MNERTTPQGYELIISTPMIGENDGRILTTMLAVFAPGIENGEDVPEEAIEEFAETLVDSIKESIVYELRPLSFIPDDIEVPPL